MWHVNNDCGWQQMWSSMAGDVLPRRTLNLWEGTKSSSPKMGSSYQRCAVLGHSSLCGSLSSWKSTSFAHLELMTFNVRSRFTQIIILLFLFSTVRHDLVCFYDIWERGSLAVVECQTLSWENICSNPLCRRFKAWGFRPLHDAPVHPAIIN